MLCWHVRMLLSRSQHHICALEHFVTKRQTITALSQVIITVGWAGAGRLNKETIGMGSRRRSSWEVS